MDEILFAKTLRDILGRQPFIPFFVDLNDGRTILVDYPSLAFSGGAAAFLAEDAFVPFRCDEVTAIRPATAEATS
jgi:hypothetical protein